MTIRPLAGFLLGLVYPRRCRVCGEGLGDGERFLCGGCAGSVAYVPGPVCSVCGRPFPGGAGGGHPCRGCMSKPPPFDRAAAPLLYEGAAVDAIHLFKYRHLRALEGFLGGFVADAAAGFFDDATVAAAVPLHKRRLRRRGFNQSLLLAGYAARRLGVGLSVDGLVRTRNTKPQVGLGPSERVRNVRGAFSVKKPGEMTGENVLLVDDVFTTGATAAECARVLKKAGAKAVYVLTVARAGRD